jgi:hypothetical protein
LKINFVRMKKNLILFLGLILFNSCVKNKESDVLIKSLKDTVYIDSIYYAELYIDYNQSVLPSFYIVKMKDTFQLAVDSSKKCAVYRALNHKKGIKHVKGFVKYKNEIGKNVKKDFNIIFYVK